ncbi:hypothetical protein AVEN_215472-1 [Araneus ventricosus]|uniref:Uncharacterized protein n=1 Tax=Araneus ventricosus TaxID=182803 RepID=A0A4Y2LEX3_ARAVE|nr:hypothetical protein AVEN_215472-1 [Araneus ventricosus]
MRLNIPPEVNHRVHPITHFLFLSSHIMRTYRNRSQRPEKILSLQNQFRRIAERKSADGKKGGSAQAENQESSNTKLAEKYRLKCVG